IEANAPNIDLERGTQSGLIAHAKLFKALAIGNLAQNFEQVVIVSNNDNQAEFVPRAVGYENAIALLNEAKSGIDANPISDEFINTVTLGNIDIPNSVSTLLARYNLFVGNYEAAITAANNVNLTSTSEFVYDSQNLNPIWSRVFLNDAPNFKPRDNFGLPAEFVFNPEDGRISFYLVPLDETNQNGLPIEDLAGFYNVNTGSIPLYIPDEINLIIAEANVRKANPDFGAATAALDMVLTDTDDPFGINANVEPYEGPQTTEALLSEIYKNRRAELFLMGLSLEDSRRFDRPEPSGNSMIYTEERNRNFYPYPDLERNSNPNTPDDPNS
ncbi:hypothetical protein LCGC14_0917480, partial [marine sediment metagenome]